MCQSVEIEVRAFACLAKTVPSRSEVFVPKFRSLHSTSIIPSRLAELHQTLVAKREWACLVLPSGTGWESQVLMFFLLFCEEICC